MKIFAVVPAYKEEGRIGAVVRALSSHVHRVIVVDDGSGDATAAEASAAGAETLVHAINRGQGAALRTGVMAALEDGADVVLHFDADGQHDPESIGTLVAPIAAGDADAVFGSRFMGVRADGMPASRRLLLRAARVFNMLALGIPSRYTDPSSGLRAMTADAARHIDFRQDRMAHCSEILLLVAHSDLRAMEVPTRVRYTDDTLAKGQKASNAIRIVWQLFLGAFQR